MNKLKKLLILDDGHGYNTGGKRTPPFEDGSQIREWEWNKAVTLEIGRIAQSYGLGVAYTKNTSKMEQDLSINERIESVNDFCGEFCRVNKGARVSDVVLISSHYNAFNSRWDECSGGIETIIHGITDTGTMELAQIVHKRLVGATGLINRGVKLRRDLGILAHTHPSALLIEYGFMDVKKEALLMKDKNHITKCAQAVVDGVCEYWGYAPQVAPQQHKPSSYAEEAWAWACELGLFDSTTPQGTITREQVACVFHRFSKLRG